MHLQLTDYQSETRWRWVLSDDQKNFLADHEVALDVNDPRYQDFLNVPRRMDYAYPYPYVDTTPETLKQWAADKAEWMRSLGEWAGEKIFGGLRAKLSEHLTSPVTVAQVTLPAAAQALLFRPFELAHLDGEPLATAGLRFVYTLEGQKVAPGGTPGSTTAAPRPVLRVLTVFSLPEDASALNLREERYQLQHQLEGLARTQSRAVFVRVVQYGATRATLQDALADGEGWDIIHFSGHGLAGELVLEKDDGSNDKITAEEFVGWLKDAPVRPQLVTLSACYSGAASLSALRAERAKLRGETAEDAEREAVPAPPDAPQQAPTRFPSLAQQVADGADCAALAMRYAVGDEFAIALLLGVFDSMLRQKHALPAALQTALRHALENTPDAPETSAITPILFGHRAAALTLIPPKQPPEYVLADTGLGIAFPPEPQRFVGRLMPMLRASRALAPGSEQVGVLFYGMAGAGKTSCALELAYRHERDRFTGYVWFKAPDEDQPVDSAFTDFLLEIERQLSWHDLGLTTYADQPTEFARRTAPRIKDLLSRNSILVVIDNAESLLSASNQWRDPKWKMLVEDVLLAHSGPSRLVLTSRRLPAPLEKHPRLSRESIHALSARESVLLSRQLPNLRRLADDTATRSLWFLALEAAQGHPKLLELADKMAEKLDELQARVSETTTVFFQTGETAYTPDDFIATLTRWTQTLAANLTPTATLLLYFLARLEEEDLQSQIVEANWDDFLKRLAASNDPDLAGFREANLSGLAEGLAALTTSGLLEARPITNSQLPITIYHLHPAIAETSRALAPAAVLSAADWELGNYWGAVHEHGIKNEMQGLGHLVVEGGKRAAPYLLRARRWEEAGTLLERVIVRDTTPATLAFALPALRQIVQEDQNAETSLIASGVLAKALQTAGRYAEAEQMERDRVARCVAQGNYRLASVASGQLLNVLWALGRAQEALPLAEQMADYARRAGLGQWTQLGDVTRRLQLLNALGRYAEVLAEVERLRPQLDMPETGALPETVNPWNVREGLLDTGRFAARSLEQWQTALSLNADILRYRQARNADAVELARTRFNDYGPLLRLRRYPEARAVLETCRVAFEQAHEIANLGKVFSGLADLEGEEGHLEQAARFEQIALRYKYQAGEPEGCAISHNNLASYLSRLNQPPALVLAHRLAACVISLQTGSGALPGRIRRLQSEISNQKSTMPFDEVVRTVEQIEGVRFGALFAQLPKKAQSGDEAIAAVWEMAESGSRESEDRRQKAAQVLAGMPEAIRKAFELDGEDFRRAMGAALKAMPEDEARAIIAQLQEAGLIGGGAPQSAPDMKEVLLKFEPLLLAIAAVAKGDIAPRKELEEVLPKLEQGGWQLMGAIAQLWSGERDEATLTEGIDPNSALLVKRILELIEKV